jgi:hypothetical protein
VFFVFQTKPPAAGAAYCYVGAAETDAVPGIAAGRRGSDATPADESSTDDVQVTHSFKLTEEQHDRPKYECPVVKRLREVEVTDTVRHVRVRENKPRRHRHSFM